MLGRIAVACGVAATIGILVATTPADAGLIQSFPVSVDQTNRIASGSLGSAYNSTDVTQYIGCFNQISGYYDDDPSIMPGNPAYPLQVQISGGCYANDASNHFASCNLDPGELPPMSPDSYVVFTWDANGNCTGLQVWTYSQTSPKH